MNTQLEAIQSLIRINRDAMRELAKVAETTSADYVHIDNAMRMLGEQFHILLQQKEELETTVITTERKAACKTHAMETCVMPTAPNATENEKRGRGAEKQFFLVTAITAFRRSIATDVHPGCCCSKHGNACKVGQPHPIGSGKRKR